MKRLVKETFLDLKEVFLSCLPLPQVCRRLSDSQQAREEERRKRGQQKEEKISKHSETERKEKDEETRRQTAVRNITTPCFLAMVTARAASVETRLSLDWKTTLENSPSISDFFDPLLVFLAQPLLSSSEERLCVYPSLFSRGPVHTPADQSSRLPLHGRRNTSTREKEPVNRDRKEKKGRSRPVLI